MKKTFFYTLLISAASLILGLMFWSSIPQSMPVHWDAMGNANGFAPKALGLFLMPACSALTAAILLAVAAKSKDRRNDRALQRIAILISIFMFSMQALMVHAAMKTDFVFSMSLFLVALGALVAAVGTTMPMLHPNIIAGVRTPWNNSSDINWQVTHRAAKWCMIAGGVVAAGAGLLLTPPSAFWVGFAAILLGSVAPIGVSYTVHCVQNER